MKRHKGTRYGAAEPETVTLLGECAGHRGKNSEESVGTKKRRKNLEGRKQGEGVCQKKRDTLTHKSTRLFVQNIGRERGELKTGSPEALGESVGKLAGRKRWEATYPPSTRGKKIYHQTDTGHTVHSLLRVEDGQKWNWPAVLPRAEGNRPLKEGSGSPMNCRKACSSLKKKGQRGQTKL